ncbi:surface lipoprotein assembly modifier [Spirabiliibacterium falconis]|uniref:surface lipoprotein assembly modifier n=1 Tax=Spirabiliibacterium falconis TaxID=572023 RepID=UPI001AADB425|nr:surface lipoprotein assembly modifier [Spirabiliibacterium falconis]MBE2893610.1 DUF560 domain-containing protein [Spirabiliibacterium falconis]
MTNNITRLSLPLLVTALWTSIPVLAQEQNAKPEPRNLPETQLDVAKPVAPQKSPHVARQEDGKTLSMSKEELAQHPDLVVRALVPALLQNNAEGVDLLLPIYRTLPKNDPLLIKWGEAILAREQGDYTRSVALYRELFAQNPQVLPVRFQMAQVLFLNNENDAAKDQFEKLRSENLPAEAKEVIEQYLQALNKRDAWSFNGGLSYIREPNINNAPKAGTTFEEFHAWEREDAQGLSYSFGMDKKWSLQGGWFTKLSGDAYGKYYWDNKKYNQVTARIGAGVGFQTARSEISLTPFFEKRWYGGGSSGGDALKQFSKTSGARLDGSYWLSPHWQISSALEYGEQRYQDRKHLNGNNYLWSNTLLYMPSGNQYWIVGADYSRDNARDKDDASDRKGVRLGWGQEWSWGLSSRIILGYGKREYKAPARFLTVPQKDDEYSVNVSLWHRSVHVWGITPRITWSYQNVKSNHPFYTYDKSRIFLELSKRF